MRDSKCYKQRKKADKTKERLIAICAVIISLFSKAYKNIKKKRIIGEEIQMNERILLGDTDKRENIVRRYR